VKGDPPDYILGLFHSVCSDVAMSGDSGHDDANVDRHAYHECFTTPARKIDAPLFFFQPPANVPLFSCLRQRTLRTTGVRRVGHATLDIDVMVTG
jgi:hypothetical protein